MRTCTYLAVVAALLASFSRARAQDANTPATRPAATTRPAPAAPDVLTGAIDPFQTGAERMAFFKAAGVDSELDAREFEAARNAGGSFVRPYDQWKTMLAFDKNRNATIDWFEAEAYRRDLRRRVLAAYDTNKNAQLDGAERQAANEALAAGRVPGEPPAGPGERVHIPEDADRPGPGGSGPQTQPTSRPAPGRAMQEAMERWRLQNFDADGDGQISPEEQQEADKFQKQLADVGQDFRHRMEDLNGDGEVTDEERQELRKQWMVAGLKLLARATSYMDTDGDGQISPEERSGFQQRMQGSWIEYMENFGRSFDANADGRLDAGERDKLVAGMSKELERRTARFDADKDGRLSPDEMIRLMEDFVQKDLGIVPSKPQTPPAP